MIITDGPVDRHLISKERSGENGIRRIFDKASYIERPYRMLQLKLSGKRQTILMKWRCAR